MTATATYAGICALLLVGVSMPALSAQAEPVRAGQPLSLHSDRQPVSIDDMAFMPSEAPHRPPTLGARAKHAKPTAAKPGAKPQADARTLAVTDAPPVSKPAVAVKERAVPLGRIPLESGTFGFDATTRLKSREFPSGEQIPSYQALKREGGIPFIGLSLSVPTSSLPGLSRP